MLTTLTIASAAKHAEWQREICEGCYFLWFLPEYELVLYSEVLPSQAEGEGFRNTNTYSSQFPDGGSMVIGVEKACMLLSREQWDAARTRGWPDTEDGIMQVLNILPN